MIFSMWSGSLSPMTRALPKDSRFEKLWNDSTRLVIVVMLFRSSGSES
jgi:hypothetical protein